MTGALLALCELSALTHDEGLRVELPDRPAIAIFLHEGEVHVVDDLCSHGDASLAEGYCEAGEVVCPFHMGRFSLTTGEATMAPCHEPIAAHRSTIVDGVIYLVQS